MKLTNGNLNAKAELLLMGKVVSVQPEDIEYLTTYVVNTLKNCKQIYGDVEEKVKEYMSMVTRYHKNDVEYMCINIIYGMIQITYVYKDGRAKITSSKGRLCYVVNVSAPDCSEMGYCFFEEINGVLHRVG